MILSAPPYSLSINTFSGFKSLCTIFLSWKYATASMIYLMIEAASASEKVTYLIISSKSSPPLHNSVTK